MPVLKTEQKRLHDVFKWWAHPAYNIDVVTITNNTVVKVAGDLLLGQLVIFTGGVWKLLVAADTVDATSILGAVWTDEPLLAGLASGATLAKVPILARGPALIHKDSIDYAGKTVSTVDAQLLKAGIKPVDETGLALQWTTPVS